ncbi:MAG: hypothetical protein EOO56_18935 [Hymenobacter sp.]|nr:MAG: hypothetical protein EOO56_18935 [Hymenobacter sp.]
MKPAQFMVLSSLLLVSCANEKSEQADEGKRIAVNRRIVRFKGRRTSPELDFLRVKKYRYITRVAAIPADALAAIEDKAQLCDEASGIPINLSDVHIGDSKECTRKLNFALVGDTTCLIVYRQGGIGVHDEVYYVHYQGEYSFTNYSAYSLDDTIRLRSFLRKQLAVVEEFSSELTPPPPWPQ